MKKTEKTALTKAINATLIGTAATFSFPLITVAQTGPENIVIEEIFVTGSRIRRSNENSPAPITVLGNEDIAAVGTTNIGEYLEKLPSAIAYSNQSNSTFSTTAAGLLTTALRNLGQERTLVLVNGRRFVSGVNPGGGYAVDLSSVPTALIDNIEVLTGGTSAIYGSDAVAGVVNIITKKDFEGVEINVHSGVSAEGDNEKNDVDITMGGSWNRGNAWASFGYSDEDGIMARDRKFSNTDLIEMDTDGDGYDDSYGWMGSSFLPQGRYGNYQGDGTPFRDGIGDRANSDRFNRANFRQLLIPVERRYAAGGTRYEFNDKLSMGLQLGFNETLISSNIEPVALDLNTDIWNTDTVAGGTGGHNIASSLLLSEKLKQNLLNDFKNAKTPNPNPDITDLGNDLTSRRLVEFGSRGAEADRSTTHAVFDMQYELDNGWYIDAFVSWGKTRTILKSNGNINVERAELALDVERAELALDVERIDSTNPGSALQCKSASARAAGCVPFNPFGLNTISAEAVAYLSAATTFRAEVEQTVLGLSTSGELPFELPGGAISIATGVEYREEKGSETPSGFVQSGIISGNAIAPTRGKFDVADVFIETRLPVLDKLAFNLAYRMGDYSTVGVQHTWKFGIESPLNDAIRLRATVSESVRAPNISDLFAGATQTYARLKDICEDITATSTGPADANCRTIPEIAARIKKDKSFKLTQVEKQSPGGFIGGNPDVKEETAKSWTAGIVLTPQLTDGLTVAIDWYNIEIDNAIEITKRTTVLKRCYSVPASRFDPTCGGAVSRSNGALVSVNSMASNENIIDTAGLDLDFRYATELNDWHSALYGAVRLNVMYNYIDKFNTTGIIERDVDKDAGEILWPKNRFVITFTYELDRFSSVWRARYWDEVNDSNTPREQDENGGRGKYGFNDKMNTKDAIWYHDIQLNYDATDALNIYSGVNNVFDEEPEILAQGSQHGYTGIYTAPEAYDVIGRRFYAGFKYSF